MAGKIAKLSKVAYLATKSAASADKPSCKTFLFQYLTNHLL